MMNHTRLKFEPTLIKGGHVNHMSNSSGRVVCVAALIGKVSIWLYPSPKVLILAGRGRGSVSAITTGMS